jgi:hypothetical protein
MKIRYQYLRRDRNGMAVIAIMALIAIIFIFVAANLRTVHFLRTDLRLLERQQTNRLAGIVLTTNSVPIGARASSPAFSITNRVPVSSSKDIPGP